MHRGLLAPSLEIKLSGGNRFTQLGTGGYLEKLARAKAALAPTDKLQYLPSPTSTEDSNLDQAPWVNLNFNVDSAKVQDILTDKVRVGITRRTLIIKKADFLGYSQWDFRHGTERIEARVEDMAWLERFHAKEIALTPGAALDCELRTEVSYGFNSQVLAERHAITRVFEVIEADPSQLGFDM